MVNVVYPTILDDLNMMFRSTSNRTIANYLMWRHAESWLYVTDNHIRRERIRTLRRRVTTNTPTLSDADECKDHVNSIFGLSMMDR